MKRLISILALVLFVTGIGIAPVFSAGIMEDTDTIENRGPANLDTPTEKDPKKAVKKEAEKQGSEKVEEAAPSEAPEAPKTPDPAK